jgi:hypothetical protein
MICKCGCGNEVKPHRKGYRLFIHGHNRKGLTDIQKVNIIKCSCGCGKDINEYDNRNRIRKYIHGQRENYCCALCFKSQSLFKRKLHIHHIDLNKKNNIDSNCISLCFYCHAKVHKRISKKEGTIILRDLLNKRYGYQYDTYQESESLVYV